MFESISRPSYRDVPFRLQIWSIVLGLALLTLAALFLLPLATGIPRGPVLRDGQWRSLASGTTFPMNQTLGLIWYTIERLSLWMFLTAGALWLASIIFWAEKPYEEIGRRDPRWLWPVHLGMASFAFLVPLGVAVALVREWFAS